MPQKLNEAQIAQHLAQIEGWEVREGKLQRAFVFDDFVQAMAFVNQMAELAEERQHHPDFCVHYNQVDVTIWTHSIDGLAEGDFVLADHIGQILEG